jgi:hypothetical protein
MKRLFFLLLSFSLPLFAKTAVFKPTFTPIPGGYPKSETITIFDNTPNAVICFTTNGSAPNATVAGKCDSGSTTGSIGASGNSFVAVTLKSTTTIKAIATLAGYTNSEVLTGTFTINANCKASAIGGPGPTSASYPNGTPKGVSDVTGSQLTVTWTTDIPADSLLVYGIGNAGTSTGLQDSGGVTSHSVTVTGLIPGKIYNWGIQSRAVISGVTCGNGSMSRYGGPSSGINTTMTSARSGSFAYGVFPSGPTYVTQGKSMFFNIGMYPLQGTYTPNSLTIALTGLPSTTSAGTTFTWTAVAKSNGGANIGYWGTDPDAITTTNGVTNDTNKFGNMNNKEVEITTTDNTPIGNYTLTITVSGSGGPTVTTTWPIHVVSSSAPFSGVLVAQVTPSSYPPIPGASTYLANASMYGAQACAQDNSKNTIIRPNDNTQLVTVSQSVTYNSWYYDGVNIYFTVDDLLLNYGGSQLGQNWAQCRENVAEVYRDKYVLAAGAPPYVSFSTGYYTDYLAGGGLHGQALDLLEIETLTRAPYYIYEGAYNSVNLQRETAYTLRNYTEAVALGLGSAVAVTGASETGTTVTIQSTLHPLVQQVVWIQNSSVSGYNGAHRVTSTTPNSFTYIGSSGITSCSSDCGTVQRSPLSNNGTFAQMRDYTEEHVLGQFDQLCLSQNASYWESFMIGLQAKSLLEYYKLANADPRIPAAFAACADYWYANYWQKNGAAAFPYDKWSDILQSNIFDSGASCIASLTNLIAPIYAFLFQYTGNTIYQQEGDEIFGEAATVGTGLSGGCSGTTSDYIGNYLGVHYLSNGKNFSQQYYWGPNDNYVVLRSAPRFTVTPGSVGVFYQDVTTSSAPQIITLNNPTSSNVTVSSVMLANTRNSAFTNSSGTCGVTPFTVKAGSSCLLNVTFTAPATLDYSSGSLTINVLGGRSYVIPLYGTSVTGTASTPTFDHPSGKYSGSQNVIVSATPSNAVICFQTKPNGANPAGNGNQVGGGGRCAAPGLITKLSESGTTVTVTSLLNPTVNASVTISGAPTRYNGNWTVATAGGTSFTFGGAPRGLASCSSNCGYALSANGGSIVNGGTLTISTSVPLRAIATAPGYADSAPMASTVYTIVSQ